MLIPSDASSATQPNWLHLVLIPNSNVGSPENHPRYGVYKVCPAAPDKMLPLDSSSGMSPEQLTAIKDFSRYLSTLEGAGLRVGCCCQISEQSSAAESTAGLGSVVTVEQPLADPLTVPGDIQPEPSAPSSEPSASEPKSPAEPVSPVFAAASTPCPEPTGNPTASSIQSQVDKDFEFALKLQSSFNRELINRQQARRTPLGNSSKTQDVESQRGGTKPTIFWNTNCHYGKQV